MAHLSDRLKQLRKVNDMTQAEVGDRIGVNMQTISQYERGVRRPDPDTLLRLSDLFNVSLDYLLGRSDHTVRLVDEDDLARLDGEGYYLDSETAKVAQELFDDPDLRVLFDAARDSKPEHLQLAADILRKFKETNPDG